MSSEFRICFVCLGNIVRSPLAENLFKHLSENAGVSHKYDVDSAGTGSWHVGARPDSRMRSVASQQGFEYDGRARQFKRHDFHRFDLIVAMDTNNRSDLMRMAQTPQHQEKIRLLREFDPQGRKNSAVPDPYYGGIDGFEEVYEIVERSCRGLLASLEDGKLR